MSLKLRLAEERLAWALRAMAAGKLTPYTIDRETCLHIISQAPGSAFIGRLSSCRGRHRSHHLEEHP